MKSFKAHQRNYTDKIYSKEKPYGCTYCEEKYATYHALREHERWHTEEYPFQCSQCEKSFKTMKERKCHKMLHKTKKLFKCKYCSRTYSVKRHHLNHLKTHITRDKPYQCTKCGETFQRNNQLTDHSRIHTGEKPYQCNDCEQFFRTKGLLRDHMINREKKNKSSLCNKSNQENTQDNSVTQKNKQVKHPKTHTKSQRVYLGSIKQNNMNGTDFNGNQKSKSKVCVISDEISIKGQDSMPLFCDNPIQVISWLQQNKLLTRVLNCDSCYELMNWSTSSIFEDGFEWICLTKSCVKFQIGVCIKLGSFFYNSHIKLSDWFDIMYLWCENVKPNVSSDLVNLSVTEIKDCYAYIREICWAYFIENPPKIGGPGIVVEVEVAEFSYNSEMSEENPPIMVLGIIDLNNNSSTGYMEIVQASDPSIILPKLLNVVQPGSIIYTKEFMKYSKLQAIAEMDTINFLDMDSSQHISNMESFWDKHRNSINEIHEYNDEMDQNSYLQEFMWRNCFQGDTLSRLCQQISDQYPI